MSKNSGFGVSILNLNNRYKMHLWYSNLPKFSIGPGVKANTDTTQNFGIKQARLQWPHSITLVADTEARTRFQCSFPLKILLCFSVQSIQKWIGSGDKSDVGKYKLKLHLNIWRGSIDELKSINLSSGYTLMLRLLFFHDRGVELTVVLLGQ